MAGKLSLASENSAAIALGKDTVIMASRRCNCALDED